MGARLTTFENRSNVVLEIRVFVPPARPDHFRKIIRIRPGEKEEVLITTLCQEDKNPERHTIIMVFMHGVYTGASLLPGDIMNYSRVICDRNEDGLVSIRGSKPRLTDFCRLMFPFLPLKEESLWPEEDII